MTPAAAETRPVAAEARPTAAENGPAAVNEKSAETGAGRPAHPRAAAPDAGPAVAQTGPAAAQTGSAASGSAAPDAGPGTPEPTPGVPAAGQPSPAGQPEPAPGAPVPAAARPGESPWALPPQRPATSTGQDEQPGSPGGAGPSEPPAPPTAAAGQPWPTIPGQQVPPPPGAAPGDAAPAAGDAGPGAGDAGPGAGDAGPTPGDADPAFGDAAPPAVPAQPAPPPGPYPPSPGWYPPPWQGGAPVPPPPAQPYPPAVAAVPPGYADPNAVPEPAAPPTAEDFARRRQVRPADPVATMGVRAMANRMGLRLPPGRHEQERRRDIETVRRNFGGLRQVTVVNPKGGAGKTVAILLLAMTFGQKRGGYVLAWDNNETQGTLGMRAQQDFHSRTVRDLLRDLGQFHGAHGRVGDLSQYVRSQGEGMFDVLASDESATGGEMLTAAAFAEIREVVSRFYKLIFVDTGNNVRAQNWQAAMDATDQLVVTMSARNDSAETAARMLDHLEQSGRQRLVRQAVSVVSMPPSRKEIDLPAIQEHFAARTRAVLLAPYERLIDSGEPLRYGGLSSATRDAWLKIAAAVAEGL
ncbi:chromosome partitioning protein [Micromonospora sp. URMC 103]|uniref:MinD/ParA family ATP-binding protein n=1 Tax=Micromonospora sp. URMC 103 TaxID=3423406 RepID=UPI003F19BC3E